MTPLRPILTEMIEANGPMSLANYMQICLLHPAHGYYATRDPLGAGGDFTTAPEISQMFGELLGLCLAQAWMDQGGGPVQLAELGPGRGTLMQDVLRAISPHLHEPAVNLVEVSETLRRIQGETLGGHDVRWWSTLDDVPDGPLLLIANEFFDALPIRQFRRGGDGWHERRVGLVDGELGLGETEETPVEALNHRLDDTDPDQIVELCYAGIDVAAQIARRIGRAGGVALIIDYGDWRSRGDTFQAVRAHKPVDPFSTPGEADLTAHVDFEAITEAARPYCAVSQMTSQGVLLERLGITSRAQKLAAGLTGSDLDNHVSAHRRLTHPTQMGQVFKAIALYPNGQPCPPGFDP